MANVSLTIDGQQVVVPAGTTVLDAAKQVGIEIPTFCHEKDLTAPGACRICVVEVEGARNLPPACVTQAMDGMVVNTDSPAVVEARSTILELIVANHPLDCMTCVKAGNCKLQDYAYRYGIKDDVYQGEKKSLPVDDSNPYIYRDLNKCILCGKCVATCNAVQERSVIDYAYRGFNTKIATAMDTELKDSKCVYCNRCVAICPVGALSDKTMMGKGREWEFTKESVTCTFCDAGCQFDINYKNGRAIGITANAAAAGRPLCLKGRLGTGLVNDIPVLEQPLLNKDGEFVAASWEEVLGLESILEKIKGRS